MKTFPEIIALAHEVKDGPEANALFRELSAYQRSNKKDAALLVKTVADLLFGPNLLERAFTRLTDSPQSAPSQNANRPTVILEFLRQRDSAASIDEILIAVHEQGDKVERPALQMTLSRMKAKKLILSAGRAKYTVPRTAYLVSLPRTK